MEPTNATKPVRGTRPRILAVAVTLACGAGILAASLPGHAGAAPAAHSCAVLAPGASPAARQAVGTACAQVGVRYTWGGGHEAVPGPSYGHYDGSDPASKDDAGRFGFDCSGLVRYAYYQATGTDILNGTSDDQFRTSHAAARFTAAQGSAPLLPGDLMFWGDGPIHHVAMYLGAGQMVEAYASGTRIRVAPVRTGGDYAGAVRLAATAGTPPPSGPGTVRTWGSSVRTHSAPSTAAAIVDTFPGPTTVSVRCQEHAELVTADGYTNDAWSKLSDGSWLTTIHIQGPAWLTGVPTC